MEVSLNVEKLAGETGKGEARALRRAGKVPAVVYRAGQPARRVAVSPKALSDVFKKTNNRYTVLNLEVEGQAVTAMVREVQRHPVSREILHVDFYEVVDGQAVEVKVPVNPVGKAAGAVIGGKVRVIRREIKLLCDWKKIPLTVDVDVTPLNIGDIIRSDQLALEPGVAVVTDRPFNVVSLFGRRVTATAAAAAPAKKAGKKK